MRELYKVVVYWYKEIVVRASAPLCIGVYMLASLKKQLFYALYTR